MIQYIIYVLLSFVVVNVKSNNYTNSSGRDTFSRFNNGRSGYNYNQNYNRNEHYTKNYESHMNGRFLRLNNMWNIIDYKFPSAADRQNAINTGIYYPNNLVPIGIAVVKNMVILSMPVFFENRNPASLAYYELPSTTLSPQLQPYPDWSWHDRDSCDDIISAFRMQIDDCGRLWVIDSGLYNIIQYYNKICPPKVIVFDTRNNHQFLFKVEIPQEFLRNDSLLNSIVIEYLSPISCTSGVVNNAVIYLNDESGFGLIVVDLSKPVNERIWRIIDKTMFPTPAAGSFNIAGTKFDTMEGIFALNLGPVLPGNNRELHYYSFSGYQKYKVNTKVLRNKTLAADSENYKCTIHTRPNQSAGGVIDKRGVFFFSLLRDNAIGCWNTYKSPVPQNIVTIAKDDVGLQFITNLFLDQNGGVWVLSSRFQKLIIGEFSQYDSEANFRVFYAPSTDELVRGTNCAHNYNNLNYVYGTSQETGFCY